MYTGLLRGMWFHSLVVHYKAVISLVDRTLDFQSRDKSLNLLWSLAYKHRQRLSCFIVFYLLSSEVRSAKAVVRYDSVGREIA